MTGNRPRARLTAGGPMWDERQAKAGSSRAGLSKAQRKTVTALGVELVAVRDALREGRLKDGWGHRAKAWALVDQLPSWATREQRRALWQCKILLLDGERRRRERRNPPTSGA